LIIERLVVGPFQTNCYVVGDAATLEGAVIDPGGDSRHILDVIEHLGLHVQLVINTHGHVDHIAANADVLQETGAQLAIHADDAAMLTDPLRSLSVFLGKFRPSPAASKYLVDGQDVAIGQTTLRVLHVPGHSPGGIGLWCAIDGAVFCGDTLFRLGIGRFDLPGGNGKVLLDSIRSKLLILPDQTIVYPGHGPQTTIGFERLNNPYLT